jgi:hypothetical protein
MQRYERTCSDPTSVPKSNRLTSARSSGLALIRDSQQHDTSGKLTRYETRLMSGAPKTMKMPWQLQSQHKFIQAADPET